MTTPLRPDGRKPDELRPLRVTRSYTKHTPGSVLMEYGDTRVLEAQYESMVGWVEYMRSMAGEVGQSALRVPKRADAELDQLSQGEVLGVRVAGAAGTVTA